MPSYLLPSMGQLRKNAVSSAKSLPVIFHLTILYLAKCPTTNNVNNNVCLVWPSGVNGREEVW